MLLIESNQDLEKKLENNKEQEIQLDSLSGYILDLWSKALTAKQKITPILLKCERARKCEYDPEKLAELRSLFGPTYNPPYIPLTLAKCLAGEAWIKEIIFESSQPPFDIQPTPVPELDKEELESIVLQTINEESNRLAEEALASGGLNQYDIYNTVEVLHNRIKLKVKLKIKDKIKEITKDVKEKLDDQLLEGNWYSELRKFIYDLVTFPSAIFSGPFFVKAKKLKKSNGTISIEEEVTPRFRRVSPYNIFPSPDATDIHDGYLFELITYTKDDLYNFLDLFGTDNDAVIYILDKYMNSGYKMNLTDSYSVADMHNKDSTFVNSDNIDCLVFWGKIPGRYLKEWNIQPPNGITFDDFRPYDVCAWIIDSVIIRVILNPDPLGKKPYYKTSFFRLEDSFWGMGIPQVLEHLQSACNSIARNILLNSAFASGPISEVNIDRLADGETANVYPFKTFQVTSQQMLESPVVRFNQAPLIADRLINVYRHFSLIADEVTIPAYAYGNPSTNVGRTASGLAMLREGASMTIKNVISDIDMNIIQPSIEQLYVYDVVFNILPNIPDVKIWAMGSSILMLKEQKARDLLEIMNFTNNPVDIQFIDRQKLIEAILNAKGLDITEIMKEGVLEQYKYDINSQKNLNPQLYNIQTGGTVPSEQKTDVAGNDVAGQNTRLFGNGEQ